MRRVFSYICLAVTTTLCLERALLCDDPPPGTVADSKAAPSSNDYVIKKSAPIVVTDEEGIFFCPCPVSAFVRCRKSPSKYKKIKGFYEMQYTSLLLFLSTKLLCFW